MPVRHDGAGDFGSEAQAWTVRSAHAKGTSDFHLPRVFLIAEVRLFREGLVASLSRHDSTDLIGAGGVELGPRAILDLRPDVVLLSSVAPGALSLLRCLKDAASELKVVAFALADDADLVAWAAAGASGYVDSAGSAEDLVAAIRAAARGELTCSPRLASQLLAQIGALGHGRPAAEIVPDTLTRREREVLDLLEEGLCNKEIARCLGIGHATIKNHVHHILTKLHARRRGELAARLRREQERATGSGRIPRQAVS